MNSWKKVYAQPWLKISIGEGSARDGVSIYETFDSMNMALVNIMDRYKNKVFDVYSKPFFKPFVTYVREDLDVKWVGNRYKSLTDVPDNAFKSLESIKRHFNR